ncbi:MAG: D-alanine--D-alanine ligase [Candidatus Omnitrophica bacterium]|nr:D-alanine--D-alanine ligase [Candidatus Omnitrophota bacterium]
MNKLRVAVVLGGFSSERGISLRSGAAAAAALEQAGYPVTLLDFQTPDELRNKLRTVSPDCVFNALHGHFGEDGGLQRLLDELSIPYTGSPAAACALSMDKHEARAVFQAAGLRVPAARVIRRREWARQIIALTLPAVVKPARQGSSIGMSIVEDMLSLANAVDYALTFDDTVLIEEYIHGREVTVGILDEMPLPVVEVVPKNKYYDYQAKYTPGMTEYRVPADVPAPHYAAVQAAALTAHRALGCAGFSRVDFILPSAAAPVILELNAIPGMTATSLLPKAAAAAGISFAQLCECMILAGMRAAGSLAAGRAV